MRSVSKQGGVVFFIVKFTSLDRYFIVPYDSFEKYWERMKTGGRKSITLIEFEAMSLEIQPRFNPRLDYLKAVSMIIKTPNNVTERQDEV